MTNDDYRTALDAAIKEYEELGQQREEIDKRLAHLAQTIGTLSRLIGLVPTVPMGLTDACRLVTRSGIPMTPTEVRDRLQGMGFDLSSYSSELSGIHTVLKRLNEAGELRIVPRPSGKDAYLWQRPVRAIAIGPEIAEYLRNSGRTPDEPIKEKEGEEMMVAALDVHRRFYAEEIQIASNLRTPALVEALATVPRERFLPAGPWVVRGEADFQGPLRHTPGDDPRFTYHNVSIAIDPERMLFNGAPGFVMTSIDALGLEPGNRVLHIGAGTGYYTAVMAHAVGSRGQMVAIEVDPGLAAQATANLTDWPWAGVRAGDGREIGDLRVDAIFVNAGVTHPEPAWLEALASGGRMIVPLTATMPMPGVSHPAGAAMANISRGLMLKLTKSSNPDRFDARVITFVAIFSALGLRDDTINTALAGALKAMPFPALRQFRLDTHDPDASCWCHTTRGCWSTNE